MPRKVAPKSSTKATLFSATIITHPDNKAFYAVVIKPPKAKIIRVLWFKGETCYRTDEIEGIPLNKVIKTTQSHLATGADMAEHGLTGVKVRVPKK